MSKNGGESLVADFDRSHSQRERDLWVWLGASALLLTLFAIGAFHRVPVTRPDFSVFYWNAVGWRHGAGMYSTRGANLAPPLLMLAVFVPLSLTAYRVAQALWTAVNLILLLASVDLIRRELRHSPARILLPMAVTFGAFYAWMEGQVTWLLLLPLTCAWRAYRHDRFVRAGLWLAPAIVAKPILALTALLLPWPVWMSAGAASVALTSLGILWAGWSQWAAWLKLGSGAWWLAYPANASLWGLASRWQTGDEYGVGIARLHPAWWIAIAVAAVAAIVITLHDQQRDRRMLRALLVTLATAPLGWVYYLPWILGPFATRRFSRFTLAALICFCVPIPLLVPVWQHSPVLIRTLGSAYGLGLIVLWAATHDPQTDAP